MSKEHAADKSAAPGEPGAFDPAALAADIRGWGVELGFARIGIANIDLAADEAHFLDWLGAGFEGEMSYMARHGRKRARPAELVPGTPFTGGCPPVPRCDKFSSLRLPPRR